MANRPIHKKECIFEVTCNFSEQRVRVWRHLSCFHKKECGLGPPVSFQTTVVCNETPVNQLGYKSLRAILWKLLLKSSGGIKACMVQ